jgi:O-antigen/teichoic acid export membrane protein
VTEVTKQALANRRRLPKEALLVAAGQAGSAVGALVGVRLLSQALAPAEYGELALAMTVVTFLQQTLVLPIQSAALRFYVPAQEMGAGSTYASAVRWLAIRVAAICLAITVLLVAALELGRNGDLGILAALSGLFTIVLGLGMTIDGIQNASRRRLVTAWHDSLSSWSRFLLAAGFIYLTRVHTSAIAMVGYCVSALLTLVSQGLVFPPRIPRGEAGSAEELRRRMIAFALPLSVFGLSFALQMAAERWSLRLFATTAQVGEYAVLVQLGYYPLVTMSNFLIQLVAPLVFAEAGNAADAERRARARRMTWRILAIVGTLTLLLAGGAWILHGVVFRIFVAPGYRGVSWLLPFVVLNAGMLACGQVAALTLMTDTRTGVMVAPKLTTAVLTLVVCLVGAKRFGIAGVVGGGVIPATTYFVWVLLLSVRANTGQATASIDETRLDAVLQENPTEYSV